MVQVWRLFISTKTNEPVIDITTHVWTEIEAQLIQAKSQRVGIGVAVIYELSEADIKQYFQEIRG